MIIGLITFVIMFAVFFWLTGVVVKKLKGK